MPLFPQTFEKGEDTRLVSTAGDAVKAKFDGFRLVEGSVEPTDAPRTGPTYAELRTEAKELGVPAVGQYDDLLAAVERGRADKAGRDLEASRLEASKPEGSSL